METQSSFDTPSSTNQLSADSDHTSSQVYKENESKTDDSRKTCKSAQLSHNRSPLPVSQQILSLSKSAQPLGRHSPRTKSVSPLALVRKESQLALQSGDKAQLDGRSSNQSGSLALSDVTELTNPLNKSYSYKHLHPDFSSSSSLRQQSSLPNQMQEPSNGTFRQRSHSLTGQNRSLLRAASKLSAYFPSLSQSPQPGKQSDSSAPFLPPLSRNDSLTSSLDGRQTNPLKPSVSFSRVNSIRSFSTLEAPSSLDYEIEDDEVFPLATPRSSKMSFNDDNSGSNNDHYRSKSSNCESKNDDYLTKSAKKKRLVLLSDSSDLKQRQSFADVVEAVKQRSDGRTSLERSKDKRRASICSLKNSGSLDGSTCKQTTDDLVKEVQKRFTRNISRRISRASLLSLTSSFDSCHSVSLTKHKITKQELKEKWLNAIKVVRSIVRLSLWLKDYSRSREEPQTIEQLNYYSMRTEFASEKLVFDKGYYASSNVIYTPPWARRMMSLEPEDRSPNDIQHLASILRSMKFFKNEVPPEKVYDLCKHCRYSRYEKQRLLVRNGHRSMFTYLILSGSVFVNIEEKNIDSGRKYYRTALILGQGTIFGEIAVIHDVPRTASIVVREDVELLVIDKDTCLRIFPEIMKRDYELRLEKMRATDLLKDWPEESLHALCVVSKKLEYPYGAVIEKNTCESEFIYVVTKGRVEVMCYISLSSYTTPITHEDKVVQKLIRNPPNHTYLPPMPAPAPPLFCRKSLDKAANDGKVLVSVDSLTPYDFCDLVSLNKHSQPMALILVSRGSEVIRIPKLRLHTIPPIRFWKAIVERAKDTPRYPPKTVLSRIFVEHAQWKSYRGIVLRDVLSYTSDCHPVVKGKKSRKRQDERTLPAITLQYEGEEWEVTSGESDDVFTAPSYKKCLSLYAPLHDIKGHSHPGPCLRSWRKPQMETRRLISPIYKKRALSLTSHT